MVQRDGAPVGALGIADWLRPDAKVTVAPPWTGLPNSSANDHGPGSDEVAAQVAETIRIWDHPYLSREAGLDAPGAGPRRVPASSPSTRP